MMDINKEMKTILYSSAALITMLSMSTALANPQGGAVTAGTASIHNNGLKTDIYQNSNKAIIDWNSFDINTNEHTQFHQPSASSITLNRIHDTKASQINGQLTANGHIMLLNQNGVVFGNNAQVDVGSITVTTADIDNEDFMAGVYDFKYAGDLEAAIINHGSITARDAGLVNLVAPQVENKGLIFAKMGKVQMAAADTFTLDLAGDGFIQIALSDEDATRLVKNSGHISAESGYVALTAVTARNIIDSLVENSGVIEAKGLETEGGKIILSATSGTTRNSGTLDASGANGGGEILVGGDYQGQGDLATSSNTIVTNSAIIRANAEEGDGGKIIVWGDETTIFAGHIEAFGGFTSGNGGFVETSGKINLHIEPGAYVNASARDAEGLAGSWLLDPSNVTITDGGTNSISSSGGTIDPASDNYSIDAASITAALNNGNNVTITTTNAGGTEDGNITVTNATIEKTVSNNDVTLTLEAHNNIIITSSSIISTADALNLILNADIDQATDEGGRITIEDSTITTNNGYITAGGGSDPSTMYAKGNATQDDGILISNSTLTTGTGNISLKGAGFDDIGTSYQYGVHITDTALLETTTGNITIDGIGGAGNDYNMGVIVKTSSTLRSADGTISITAQGNSSEASGSAHNRGFTLSAAATLETTGAGDIIIDATGGDGGSNRNYGAYFTGDGTNVTTTAGSISITGEGGTRGDSSVNLGIYIQEQAVIQSTSGDITISGTGANGYRQNHGVQISDEGTLITSSTGAISITGVAQTGGGTEQEFGHGVYIHAGADIISTGTGVNASTITLHGTAADVYSRSRGVITNSADTLISSIDGDITITGVGGSSIEAGSNNNYAVFINASSAIQSTGTTADAANIIITGTGGSYEDDTYGVYVANSSTVTTAAGDINITARSNGTVDNNHGFVQDDGAIISSSLGGNITIDADGGTGGFDIKFYDAGSTIGDSDDTNNITLKADNISIADGIIAASNTITITPQDSATTIGIGDGIGTLSLTSDTLALLNAGTTLIIGEAVTGTGALDLDNWDLSSTSYDVELFGRGVDIATLTLGAGDFTATSQDGPDLYVSGAISKPDGTESDLILRSDRDIYINANILTSNGSVLNTVFNSDRNLSQTGSVNFDHAIVDTNGGYLVAGGGNGELGGANGILGDGDGTGADDVFAYGTFNTTKSGVLVKASTLRTDEGDVFINGHGRIAGGNNFSTGVSVHNGSRIIASSGNINIVGEAYINKTGTGQMGLNMNNGSIIQTTTDGDIYITVTGSASGDDSSAGIRLVHDDTQITTHDGSVYIDTESRATNVFSSNAAFYISSNVNEPIKVTGAGNIEITAQSDAANTSFFLEGILGGSAMTGDITLIGDSFYDTLNYSVETLGDIYIKPLTTSQNINLNSIDSGLYLDNTDISFFNPGGTLYIGDSVNGTGTIDIDNLDLSSLGFDVSLFGGAIDIGGLTLGSGDFTAHALNNQDLVISSDIVKTVAGSSLLDLRADKNVVLENNDITVSNGSLNIIFNSDRDANQDGSIVIDTASITSNGGYFIAGGGADPENTDAWGNADYYSNGITLQSSSITTNEGYITLSGHGSDNDGTGNNNGIVLNNGSILTTTTGDITLTGTGGDRTDSNKGLFIGNSGTLITSETGDILITGTGGSNGAAGSDSNFGIYMLDGAQIISTGTDTDASTITLIGTGGAGGGGSNIGIDYRDSGTLISSINGDILLDGTGGSNGASADGADHGIRFVQGADITSTGTSDDAATITINGTSAVSSSANYGVIFKHNNTTVSSLGGDIIITGESQGRTGNNYGVLIQGGADLDVNNGTDLFLTGITTSNGTTNNDGLRIEGSGTTITIEDGNATLSGTALGNDSTDDALLIYDSAQIIASGSGTLRFEGTSDTNSRDLNIDGATVTHSGTGNIILNANKIRLNSAITTNSGDIIILPEDSATTIGLGDGLGTLSLTDAELSLFNAGGNLIIGDSVNGTGTIDVDNWDLSSKSYDVNLYGGAIDIAGLTLGSGDFTAHALNDQDLTISGNISKTIAGSSTLDLRSNTNILFEVGNSITASDGPLNVIFNADRDANQTGYISVEDADITTLGGDIIMGGGLDPVSTFAYGIAGSGTVDNGISIFSTSVLDAGGGDITIRGHGTDASGTGNIGVYIEGDIITTGTGTITLVGDGGNGTSTNSGVYVFGTASDISAENGDITITGTGYGTGANNHGIHILNGADIHLTGDGSLHMTGTGSANSTGDSDGIKIKDSGTIIESQDGDLNLTGYVLGTRFNDDAVIVHASAQVVTRGSGDIIVNATTDPNAYGVRIATNGVLRTTGTGSIDIHTTGSTNNNFEMSDSGIIDTSLATHGNVNIHTDTFALLSSSTITTSGDLMITPNDDAATIGLGSGSGTLSFDNSELALLTIGSSFIIGDSVNGTGLISIDNADASATGLDIEIYGGDITVDTLFSADESLLLHSKETITLNGDVSVNGADNSLILVAQNNFVNNAGADALDAGAGRYLVYANTLNDVSKGGLTAGHLYNRTYSSSDPSAISAGLGDRFVYTYQPTLTFTADDIFVERNAQNFNAFTYSYDGLLDGDLVNEAFSGTPSFSKTPVSQRLYNILIGQGSLTSEIGYDFSFVHGELTESLASGLTNSVEQQMTFLPDLTKTTPLQEYTLSVSYNETNTDGAQPPKKSSFTKNIATSNEKDAGVRLVQTELVNIEDSITSFFDLCSYNGAFCNQ